MDSADPGQVKAESTKPAEVKEEPWDPLAHIRKVKEQESSKATIPPGATNEIRLGMTFTEVEVVLGRPQTRVDLGAKVLYKYKHMTVEFQDGKGADVR